MSRQPCGDPSHYVKGIDGRMRHITHREPEPDPTSDAARLDDLERDVRGRVIDSGDSAKPLNRTTMLWLAEAAATASDAIERANEESRIQAERAEFYEREMRKAVEWLEKVEKHRRMYAMDAALAVLNAALSSSAPAATPRPK